MPAQKTSPDRVVAERNTQEALKLRSAALSYSQIAARLGVSKTTAFDYVSKALAELREDRKKRAGVLLDLELERLDYAQRGVWGRVVNGDVQALAIFLRLSERRSRLLGLDAPTKLSPTDPDGNPLTGGVMIYVPDNGRLSPAPGASEPAKGAKPAKKPKPQPGAAEKAQEPAPESTAPESPPPPSRRVRRPRV